MAPIQDLKRRTATAVTLAGAGLGRARAISRPGADQLRSKLAPVSRFGWTVLASSFGCWLLGWRFGWVELMLLATAALILFVVCVLLTIGRTTLRVDVEIDPQRVVVGEPAAGQVRVTNLSRGALLPIALELPIGISAARFSLPTLRGGSAHEELFVVPTTHRGVIPIGPAQTVRGDPLGLLRRSVSWTHVIELFVHPITVALEPLGAGLLRDLEGHTTNDLSMSDLAFHALRDYQPGDDRRYIHWRSSAKAGKFLVRQFLDTRRSHVTTVVDSDVESYADAEDYEMAISAAASVTVRALLDEQEITVLAGDQAVPSGAGRRVLDAFSRAELATHGLSDLAARAARIAPDTSIALIVTGSAVPFVELRRAASHFSIEVRTIALRIDPSATTGISGSSALMVLTLRNLSELAALLQGTLR
jgi:uncharacterized protein (DUF58 family)